MTIPGSPPLALTPGVAIYEIIDTLDVSVDPKH
jgi:hypothetical protein